MQTFELRQYTMQLGRRDEFVTLFDREFTEPQEACGAHIVGQFRDLNEQDRFVWIRGNDDMPARKTMMHAFYDGPHWKAHRDAANNCIADSDNVLLFRPAWAGSGFAKDGERAPPGATAAPGIVTVNLCYLATPPDADFIAAFRDAVAAIPDAKLLAALITEPAANNFPRHPLRESENVFAAFTLSDGQGTPLTLPTAMTEYFVKPIEVLHLAPTPRSRLLG